MVSPAEDVRLPDHDVIPACVELASLDILLPAGLHHQDGRRVGIQVDGVQGIEAFKLRLWIEGFPFLIPAVKPPDSPQGPVLDQLLEILCDRPDPAPCLGCQWLGCQGNEIPSCVQVVSPEALAPVDAEGHDGRRVRRKVHRFQGIEGSEPWVWIVEQPPLRAGNKSPYPEQASTARQLLEQL